MALGIINPAAYVPLQGLIARTSNAEAVPQFNLFAPQVKDVGYVIKNTYVSSFLWDGSENPATITGDSCVGDPTGITFSVAFPLTLLPGESRRMNTRIGVTVGPLAYDDIFTFLSSCAIDPILEIIGTRAPQVSGDIACIFLPHNWIDGLDETIDWKTDVMIAHDRTEQRMQMRLTPRRQWDVLLLAQGAFRRKIEGWLTMRKTRFLIVPIWRDACPLSLDMLAGSNIIFITESSDNYTVGTYVALWTDEFNYEVRTITGIGANYVSVDTPFTQDWFANITLMGPCRIFLGYGDRKVARGTDDVATISIHLTATQDSWTSVGKIIDTYAGHELCPFSPSFDEGDEEIDNKWVVLDNDTGVLEYAIESEEPVLSRQATFIIEDKNNIHQFLRFIKARAGRLSAFWLPATDTSFVLMADASINDSYIVIENIDYASQYKNGNFRTYIQIELRDGTFVRRKITNNESLPSGNEKLILDDPLSVALSSANVVQCCWLELVRFDTDSIKLHWDTNRCLTVSIPIITLP